MDLLNNILKTQAEIDKNNDDSLFIQSGNVENDFYMGSGRTTMYNLNGFTLGEGRPVNESGDDFE